MLIDKRVLAVGTAVVLGAGSGFATSVLAQVTAGPPTTAPGNPPITVAPAAGGPSVGGEAVASNFRRDGTLSVMQHPREGYEARGIRVGTFLVYPQVSIQAQHDDNIFATSTNETDDVIWRVQPQISANSDWIRHGLQLYARGSFNRYADNSDENTEDYGAGATGRLDVARDTTLTGNLNYTRATEPRTSANSPTGATEPVQYDLWSVGVQGRHEFNRLLAAGRIQSLTYDYKSPPRASGGFIDQSYRNRTVTTIGGRLDYALSPKTAFFVDVQGEKHEYDSRPTGGITRDSDGYQVLGGLNFEVSSLARGDIGVGYRKQRFDDPASKDLDGWSANAQLEWFPTQLTTVTLSGTRTIEDSAVGGAPAYLSTNFRARVDHELLRNVILTGQVGYGDDDYTGIVREDRRKSASIGANYLINRTLGVSVTYDYGEQKTRKGVGNNFTDNKVAATLTVQY